MPTKYGTDAEGEIFLRTDFALPGMWGIIQQ